MPSRIPLPGHLAGTAFRTSHAEALGLGRGRLRGDGVQHPFHGVSAIDLDLDDVYARCRAFFPMMVEGQFFSHTTALALHRAPLPTLPPDLHISVAFPRTPPRGRGVAGHSLKSVEIGLVRGLPVVPPSEAWAQSAALLRREDLVAAADALLTGRRIGGARASGLTDRDMLEHTLRRWKGRPGAKRLAWALPRVRVGVDSRPESLLRLLIVSARLPEPEVDVPFEAPGGLILHADLAFAQQKLAIEYEGDVHRVDRTTWVRDIERRELAEDSGWRVIRVTSDDLFRAPHRLLARIRSRLATAPSRGFVRVGSA